MKSLKAPIALVFLLILVDQTIKIWIKTTFALGESLEIFPWFQLHLVENPGMAYGLQWGGITGKYFLSIFRLLAILGISYYLWDIWEKGARPTAIWGLSLVLAGAIGNVADSLFYGLLFDRGLVYHAEAGRWLAYSGVAEWGSGYAPVLIGNVVDMFYFPLWKGTLPEWIPFKGGDYFIFFRPVFNFADSCVSIGILWLFFASRHPYGWMSQPNDP